MRRKLLILAWIAAFEIIGAVLGIMTKTNIQSWYLTLNKSLLTPPSIIFSIVWPILYAIIAYVGFRLWEARKQSDNKSLFNLYLIQVLLNWAWTPVFFQLRWVGIGFIIIIMLTLLTLFITIKLKKNFQNLSLMFSIYFAWLLFATYLNGFIYFMN